MSDNTFPRATNVGVFDSTVSSSSITTTTTTAVSHDDPAARSAAIARFREGKATGKELIGKTVVALANGKEVGHVHDVVYNPIEGRLVGFTIPHGGGLFSKGDTYWLAAEDVRSIGTDALVIEDASVLRAYAESADEVAEQAGQAVLGKKLMTEDGTFLGGIDDVLVDRDSRRVVAYEVSGGLFQDMMKGQNDVPVNHIISIGQDVVVVPSFVKDNVEAASGGLTAVAHTAREKFDHARTETAEAIEKKEADYALGKVAGRDVFINDANTIPLARTGETITAATIAQAIPAGKMHALALAAGYTQAGGAFDAAKAKAGELGAAAKDRYADTLVGKTTGRAVLLDNGTVLIPGSHVVTDADAENARAAGKLDDLSAAIAAFAMDTTKDKIAQAYDGAKDSVETARENHAAATAVAPASAGTPTIIINNPQQVVVQSDSVVSETGEANTVPHVVPATTVTP